MRTTLAYIVMTLIVLYGIFNARNLIMGPRIEIFEPRQGEEARDSLLGIKGQARNITYLTLNDRPIHVDTQGFFEEKLLLSPGFNTIRLYARDRFAQDTSHTLRIYYNNEEVPSLSVYQEIHREY